MDQYVIELYDLDPYGFDSYAIDSIGCKQSMVIKITSVGVDMGIATVFKENSNITTIFKEDGGGFWIGRVDFIDVIGPPTDLSLVVSNNLGQQIPMDSNIGYHCEAQPYPLNDSHSIQKLIEVRPGVYAKIFKFSGLNKIISFPIITITTGYKFNFTQVSITEFYFEVSIDTKNLLPSPISKTISVTFTDPSNRNISFIFPTFIKQSSIVPTINSIFYIDLSLNASFKEIYYRLYVEDNEGLLILPVEESIWQYASGNQKKYEILQKSFFTQDELYSTSAIYFNNYLPVPVENRTTLVNNIILPTMDIIYSPLGSVVPGHNDDYLLTLSGSSKQQALATKFKDLQYYYGYNIVIERNIKKEIPYLLVYYNSFSGDVTIGPLSIPITGSVPDTELPIINSIEFTFIGNDNIIFEVNATDNIGVYYILLEFENGGSFRLDAIDYSPDSGLFLKNYNFYITSPIKQVIVYDLSGNSNSYDQGFIGQNKIPLLPNMISKVHKNQIKIKSMRFELNDIDVTEIGFLNRLYLILDSELKDLRLEFRITGITGRSRFSRVFQIYWDETYKCYVSYTFSIPPGLFTGNIDYEIYVPDFSYSSFELVALLGPSAQLRVTSTYGNSIPPLITRLAPFENTSYFGWDVEVDCSKSSTFSISIIIQSNLESLNFPQFSGNRSSIDNQFQLLYKKSDFGMISQNFSIITVQSRDTNTIIGFWSRNSDFNSASPMMPVLDQGIESFDLGITYPAPVDKTPPILSNLFRGVESVDVTGINPTIFFTFYLEDQNPIFLERFPKCTLTSLYGTLSTSTVILISYSVDKTKAFYNCTFTLSYGFGYPYDKAYISISEYTDIYLNYGYSSVSQLSQLTPTGQYYVNLIASRKPIISRVSFPSNQIATYITIFGMNFGKDPNNIYIDFKKNGVKIPPLNQLVSNLYGNNVLIVDIPLNITYFYATVVVNGTESNEIVVTPDLNPPVPTTLPPLKCPGTPLQCGGVKNGICTATGCECISPWYGLDCLSQTISTKPPIVNTTNPETKTDLDDNTKNVTLKSLISIVSVDEIDKNDKVIKSHKFNEWEYRNSSSDTIQEFTYHSIINNNATKTEVTVTIQWFKEKGSFYFANEKIDMNPSSLKYKIVLSKYQFQSPLNRIQLVMGASFQSDSNLESTCTYQEFNQSDSLNDYMKLQIDTHSLYGRFIKRAVIDNRIQSITNKIISSRNSSTSTNSNSLIGLIIPNYSFSAIIDPDFSLLVETKSANEKSDPICFQNQKSKGLTKTQLAGIIIGCIGFALVITIGLIYYKYRSGTTVKLYITKLKAIKK